LHNVFITNNANISFSSTSTTISNDFEIYLGSVLDISPYNVQFPNINIPVLSNTAMSGIDCTSATVGGNVTSDGGAPVTERGICWSYLPNPMTYNSKLTCGSGSGSFSTTLSPLEVETPYYVRSYATNSAGTGYGAQVSYLNPITIPQLATTTSASNITYNSAMSGGNITSDGCGTLSAVGICWATTSNPTTSNSTATIYPSTGVFSVNLTGLTPSTTYFVCPYATNAAGTTYGTQISFTTSSPIVPTLAATTTATATACNFASSGGNVTSDGGATVTSRGVCWGTSPNPTTANSKVTSGSGTGSFTVTISPVWAGTTYYVRSYATNSAGTGYGAQVSYLNPITIPVLAATTAASNITYNSATSGGNITSDGCGTLSAAGICWATTSNPTTANSTATTYPAAGVFSVNLTGLTPSTTYYVRSYATNTAGTTYGTQMSFTTSAPVIPTLAATSTVSGLTCTSASSGGNVTSDGGATVTSRGVCWGTSSNPTTANSKVTSGSGTGSFTATLTSVWAGTTYYVRSYATNSAGTGYGAQISYLRTILVPTLAATMSASNITTNSASSGGNVTSDGCGTLSAEGICWATTQNPTTANSKTSVYPGVGTFSANLTGLSASTTYYVRSYATNAAGTTYGSQISFRTNP